MCVHQCVSVYRYMSVPVCPVVCLCVLVSVCVPVSACLCVCICFVFWLSAHLCAGLQGCRLWVFVIVCLLLCLVGLSFVRFRGCGAMATMGLWGCGATGLRGYEAAGLRGCGATRLCGCGAAGLRGCGAAGLRGCGAAGLQVLGFQGYGLQGYGFCMGPWPWPGLRAAVYGFHYLQSGLSLHACMDLPFTNRSIFAYRSACVETTLGAACKSYVPR